jgi:hypothetical protein
VKENKGRKMKETGMVKRPKKETNKRRRTNISITMTTRNKDIEVEKEEGERCNRYQMTVSQYRNR